MNKWLGVKLSDQPFWDCVDSNGKHYSMAGFLDLFFAAVNKEGSSPGLSENPIITLFAGNAINDLLLGGLFEAGIVSASQSPVAAEIGLGRPLTHSRRTTDILALNLRGTPGGPPQALSAASGGARLLFRQAGTALSLGLSLSVRLGIDAGMTGSLMINCSFTKPTE